MKAHKRNRDGLKFVGGIGLQQNIPSLGDFLRRNTLPIHLHPRRFGLISLPHHHPLTRFSESGAEDGMALHHDLP